MVDTLHKVGIASSTLDDVYAAITTLDGLSGWWASDTQGDTAVGGVLQFHFELGGIDMKVVERKHSACERSVLIMTGGIAACDWCC